MREVLPPPLLKGYNLGPKSQVLSWDFVGVLSYLSRTGRRPPAGYQTLRSSGFGVSVKDPDEPEAQYGREADIQANGGQHYRSFSRELRRRSG